METDLYNKKMINWTYPSSLTSDRNTIPTDENPVGKIATTTVNNSDAIRMACDFTPGQMPYRQDYGSRLKRILQDTTNLSPAFIGASTDFKNVLAKYSNTKYIATSISTKISNVNPREAIITVDFIPLV